MDGSCPAGLMSGGSVRYTEDPDMFILSMHTCIYCARGEGVELCVMPGWCM